MGSWQVHALGERASLVLGEDGLRLDGTRPHRWTWTDLAPVEFPTAFSIRVQGADAAPTDIGFGSRADQREFALAYAELASRHEGPAPHPSAPRTAPTPSSAIGLLTIHEVPGRVLVEALGLLTAQCVMSRGALSDAGSDLKTVFGGNLGGIERAIANATATVRRQLQQQAGGLGADAVVGLTITLASVADKAEAVLATGTAVRTAPPPGPSLGDGSVRALTGTDHV